MTDPSMLHFPRVFEWSDPLTRFGVRVTCAWTIVAIIGLWWLADWKSETLKPNAWGDLAAGLAAPLAFLWLVLGFLQQGRELRLQIEELRKTVQHQEDLAKATRDMVREEKEANEAARKASAEALAVSIKASEMLISMERPYVTGGGSYWRHPVRPHPLIKNQAGERRFRVDVSNYGKTPAYLVAFDVQFTKKADVQSKLLPVSRTYTHYDLLPPGGVHRHGIDGSREMWIPKEAEVVYGAFWYKDIWGNPDHEFRFILSLKDPETLSDVECVKGYRGDWD